MSVYSDTNTAIQTHLLTLTGLPTLQKEGSAKRIGTQDAYMRMTLLPSRSSIETIGLNGYTEWKGVCVIDIFYPDMSGAEQARSYGDIVCDGFTPGTTLTSNDIVVNIVNVYGNPPQSMPNYYQYPIVIEWSVYKLR